MFSVATKTVWHGFWQDMFNKQNYTETHEAWFKTTNLEEFTQLYSFLKLHSNTTNALKFFILLSTFRTCMDHYFVLWRHTQV